MRRALSIVLALSAASAAHSVEVAKTVKAQTPSKAVAALVRHQPPKGWTAQEYANGSDPVVAYENGLDRITVRAFGGPDSSYKTPALFLSGAAASTMGRKPEDAGTVAAAGRRLALYKRGFPTNLGNPHVPSGRPMLGSEFFCILPAAGGRFIVLAYARESPAPDLEGRGDAAWAAFLKAVKLPGRKT